MSEVRAPQNPFPGPQPYRAADRDYFFGREELTRKLAHRLMAHPCTTVFGPSGAGKSSLMQAGVIPLLEEAHDFRVVRVDTWPLGEAPLSWLVRALFDDLELGIAPSEMGPGEALDEAMSLAERRSERPVLIYLDQLEQLLFPGRNAGEASVLIEAVDRLAQRPIRGLQIALSLREDYLGRFRDRARGRRELLEHGFRLGPLSVGELIRAVCRAAEKGWPPPRWTEQQARGVLPAGAAREVLGRLERAAVLRAEEHQGSRYFELGHDWLASRVFQRRREREQDEAERRRREEEGRRIARERAARRTLGAIAAIALAVAAVMAVVVAWALVQRQEATVQAGKARTLSLMAGARELLARNEPATALRLLREVGDAENVRGWTDLTRDVLALPRLMVTLRGHRGEVSFAAFSPNGQRVITASADKTARVWNVDGSDRPVVLGGHEGSVLSAEFSADGQRVVTASDDKTARVWNVDGSGTLVVLWGHEGGVLSAKFRADGQRVVTASDDKTARVWAPSASALQQSLRDATTDCLSPEMRRTYLDESDEDARKGYESCERSYGRTPFYPEVEPPSAIKAPSLHDVEP
jgi:hypothetical protein